MKHFSLLFVLFLCIVFFSCHHKSDNDSTDPQPSGRLRVKYATYKGTFNAEDTLTYDANGMLTHEKTVDSLGRTIEELFYQYNDQKQLVFFSTIDDVGSNRFTYTDFNYVATKAYYSDLNGTTLTKTDTYHYDSDHNVSYIVTEQSSGSKDSSVFGPYVNGRPLERVTYYDNGSGYTLSNKYKYTYDARMNRTKILVSNTSDTTASYYVAQQSAFVVATIDQYQLATQSADPWGFDDINDNSSNKDQDFQTDEKQSESCGLGGENINSFTFNSAGYPLTEHWTFTSYICGVQDHTQAVDITFTYESW